MSNLKTDFITSVKETKWGQEVNIKVWHTGGLEKLNQDLPRNFY